jgi:hypothetical protein
MCGFRRKAGIGLFMTSGFYITKITGLCRISRAVNEIDSVDVKWIYGAFDYDLCEVANASGCVGEIASRIHTTRNITVR